MNSNKLIKYAPLLLLFVTELLLYALGLSLASLSVLNTLPSMDYSALMRDRLFCVVLFGVCAVSLGCYDAHRIMDRFDIFYYMILALALSLLIQLAVATILPEDFRVISRREIVFSVPITVFLIMAWRRFSLDWVSRFQSMHRVFYVTGDPAEAPRICKTILADEAMSSEAKFYSFKDLSRQVQDDLKRLSIPVEQTTQLPFEVIIVLPPKNPVDLREMLEFCERHFERAYLYPSLEDMLLFHQGHMLAIAGIPLIEVSDLNIPAPYAHVKRLMDVVAALSGLALSAPISIVTALMIKLTSPGPILYSQDRLGMHGKPFKIYKFRSMRNDIQLKDATGHVLAEKGDPRITPVGAFIRKHRIDEIPQLYNVLKGDMSLIGPRPVWREFYDTNSNDLPLIEMRLRVRPGLTSLSHVLGSYTSEPRDRLRYDLMYIDNVSLFMDLRIAFETVRIVLSGKGAQ